MIQKQKINPATNAFISDLVIIGMINVIKSHHIYLVSSISGRK